MRTHRRGAMLLSGHESEGTILIQPVQLTAEDPGIETPEPGQTVPWDLEVGLVSCE